MIVRPYGHRIATGGNRKCTSTRSREGIPVAWRRRAASSKAQVALGGDLPEDLSVHDRKSDAPSVKSYGQGQDGL